MRWDNLFDDLEGQLEQELGAEDVDLLAEEERLRLGRLTLRDRLSAIAMSADQQLGVILSDGRRITLTVTSAGRDWIAGDLAGDGRGRGSCIIPIAAIAACRPTPTQSVLSAAGS